MMKRLLALLLFLASALTSCVGAYVETPAPDAAVFPDSAVKTMDEAGAYLDFLAPLPQGGELLRGEYKSRELILDIKADPGVRFAYEAELSHLWYEYMDPTPETRDMICAYLHPSGWRAAFYDNRRSDDLKERYGTDEYVFRLCIKDISYDPAFFPKYPSGGKDLFLDSELFFTSKEYPAETLPESFPGLPENAVITYSGMNENGVHVTFLTDNESFYRWIKGVVETYPVDGDAYADKDGNYFRTDIEPLRVIETLDEREYSLYLEVSEETRRSFEERGIDPVLVGDAGKKYYSLDELPEVEGDPEKANYIRVTVHAVRDEWLPDWWKGRQK